MLRSLDALEEEFRGIFEKSKKECSDELEKIRQLIMDMMSYCFDDYVECCFANGEFPLPEYYNSLVDKRFLELVRISSHILFLAYSGLYRNAFNDIRYALESIVQAFYIDTRHPNVDIDTKIEIMREIEDKREYHAVRLIDELEIDYKNRLKSEYKELSRIIHPSHKQIVTTIINLLKREGIPATVDCEEISRIYDSMRKMYDICFFLLIPYFPMLRASLGKNPNFVKSIKVYNLTLLSKVFKVQLGRKRNKKKPCCG